MVEVVKKKRPLLAKKRQELPVRCQWLQLDVSLEEQEDVPVWVQVAHEGTYKGYAGGDLEFTFDRKVFDAIVRNFRAHPSFKPGSDGYGTEDVVAWDYHHASEAAPTSGVIPTSGAPAQGWVRDLDIRTGEDGKLQLWAYTYWLEPAKTQIREKRYKWSSVSVVFNAVDPISGKEVGPVLTSIALTNQPFLEGMRPLVAGKFGHVWIDSAAGSPQEAIDVLRELFSMPVTSTLEELQAEVGKLRTWIETEQVPEGINADELVGGMRVLIGLPVTSDASQVFSEFDRLVSGLSESSDSSLDTAAASAAKLQKEQEDEMELLKLIASKLGVKENDKAVLEAVDELLELREGVKASLGASKSTNKAILEKAEETKSDADGAREKLTSLLGALGVEDPDAAVNQVADLMTKAEELKKVMPELEGLRAESKERKGAEVESDVDAVMSSKGYGAEVRGALILQRRNDPEKFAEIYPKAELAKAKTLTRSVATTQTGQEITAGTSVQATGQRGGLAIDLSVYPGRNEVEQCIEHIKATVNGSDKWKWEKLSEAGIKLHRQLKGDQR